MAKSEVTKVYETILSMPGMNDTVKINLPISRRNLFVLTKLLQRGLPGEEDNEKIKAMLDVIPAETLKEIADLSKELLSKAGLTEMDEKLRKF